MEKFCVVRFISVSNIANIREKQLQTNTSRIILNQRQPQCTLKLISLETVHISFNSNLTKVISKEYIHM